VWLREDKRSHFAETVTSGDAQREPVAETGSR
jgi:hypothetical protein